MFLRCRSCFTAGCSNTDQHGCEWCTIHIWSCKVQRRVWALLNVCVWEDYDRDPSLQCFGPRCGCQGREQGVVILLYMVSMKLGRRGSRWENWLQSSHPNVFVATKDRWFLESLYDQNGSWEPWLSRIVASLHLVLRVSHLYWVWKCLYVFILGSLNQMLEGRERESWVWWVVIVCMYELGFEIQYFNGTDWIAWSILWST